MTLYGALRLRHSHCTRVLDGNGNNMPPFALGKTPELTSTPFLPGGGRSGVTVGESSLELDVWTRRAIRVGATLIVLARLYNLYALWRIHALHAPLLMASVLVSLLMGLGSFAATYAWW